MFERDKDLLREYGVPLELVDIDAWGTEQGYLIPKDKYYLPEIAFTPEELGALLVAAQSGGENSAAEQAARKLLYGADGGVLAGLAGGPLASGSDARSALVLASPTRPPATAACASATAPRTARSPSAMSTPSRWSSAAGTGTSWGTTASATTSAPSASRGSRASPPTRGEGIVPPETSGRPTTSRRDRGRRGSRIGAVWRSPPTSAWWAGGSLAGAEPSGHACGRVGADVRAVRGRGAPSPALILQFGPDAAALEAATPPCEPRSSAAWRRRPCLSGAARRPRRASASATCSSSCRTSSSTPASARRGGHPVRRPARSAPPGPRPALHVGAPSRTARGPDRRGRGRGRPDLDQDGRPLRPAAAAHPERGARPATCAGRSWLPRPACPRPRRSRALCEAPRLASGPMPSARRMPASRRRRPRDGARAPGRSCVRPRVTTSGSRSSTSPPPRGPGARVASTPRRSSRAWATGTWRPGTPSADAERLFRADRVRRAAPHGRARSTPRGLAGAGRPLYTPSGDDVPVRLRLRPPARWIAEYYATVGSARARRRLARGDPARAAARMGRTAAAARRVGCRGRRPARARRRGPRAGARARSPATGTRRPDDRPGLVTLG